jgi:hypothetical protein
VEPGNRDVGIMTDSWLADPDFDSDPEADAQVAAFDLWLEGGQAEGWRDEEREPGWDPR